MAKRVGKSKTRKRSSTKRLSVKKERVSPKKHETDPFREIKRKHKKK